MKGMLCQPTQVLVYYCISVYHNEKNAVSAHSGIGYYCISVYHNEKNAVSAHSGMFLETS